MPRQDQYGRWYDDYGRPMAPPQPGYGYETGGFDSQYTDPQSYYPPNPTVGGVRQPVPPGPNASAKLFQPGFEQMGELTPAQRAQMAYGDPTTPPRTVPAPTDSPWEPFPVFPTRPLINQRPDVGYVNRYYVVEFDAQTVNVEATRTILFQFPVHIVAVNAGVSQLPNNGSNVMLSDAENFSFLTLLRETTGERINTNETFGGLIMGTAQRPGQLGGRGWSIDAGGTLIVGVTPLAPSLTISVGILAVELRTGTNYTDG